jgi:hypothetical protein
MPKVHENVPEASGRKMVMKHRFWNSLWYKQDAKNGLFSGYYGPRCPVFHKGAFVEQARAPCHSRPAHAQDHVPKPVPKTTSHGRGLRLSCGSQTRARVARERSTEAAGEPRLPPKTTRPGGSVPAGPQKAKRRRYPSGLVAVFFSRAPVVRLCAVERAYRVSRFEVPPPMVGRTGCDGSTGTRRAQRRE